MIIAKDVEVELGLYIFCAVHGGGHGLWCAAPHGCLRHWQTTRPVRHSDSYAGSATPARPAKFARNLVKNGTVLCYICAHVLHDEIKNRLRAKRTVLGCNYAKMYADTRHQAEVHALQRTNR
jgi:hypothetical protein